MVVSLGCSGSIYKGIDPSESRLCGSSGDLEIANKPPRKAEEDEEGPDKNLKCCLFFDSAKLSLLYPAAWVVTLNWQTR